MVGEGDMPMRAQTRNAHKFGQLGHSIDGAVPAKVLRFKQQGKNVLSAIAHMWKWKRSKWEMEEETGSK